MLLRMVFMTMNRDIITDIDVEETKLEILLYL